MLQGLDMVLERDERIRERAHRIWESEGRPDDRAAIHWEIAARIIDEEDATPSTTPAESAVDQAIADTFPASDPTVMQDATTSIAKDARSVRRRGAG